MAGWTLKNLKDVKDSAVDFGLSPALEARFARDDLEVEQTGLSYQRLAPGERQPFAHRHADHEELYVVLAGGVTAVLDDERVELRPLDVVRVAASTWRGFEAGGEGLEWLAIGPAGAGEFETRPI
jgi:mannose-6-phosphate isomerase-like protein (cupin superfamily)